LTYQYRRGREMGFDYKMKILENRKRFRGFERIGNFYGTFGKEQNCSL